TLLPAHFPRYCLVWRRDVFLHTIRGTPKARPTAWLRRKLEDHLTQPVACVPARLARDGRASAALLHLRLRQATAKRGAYPGRSSTKSRVAGSAPGCEAPAGRSRRGRGL